MTREAKIGLLMVAVLIGVFGFLVYKRMHYPADLHAEQRTDEVEVTVGDNRDDLRMTDRFVDDEERPNKIENLRFERSEKKIERDVKSIGSDLKLASNDVEQLAEDVVDDGKKLLRGKERRDKPAIPRDLSADDDEVQIVESRREIVESRRVRESNDRSMTIPLPEPSNDAFDDPVEQLASPRELTDTRRQRRSDLLEREQFSSKEKEEVIEFEKPEVRQTNSEPEEEDFADASETQEPAGRSEREAEATLPEPEFPRESRDFRESRRTDEFAPRERRQPASLPLAIDDGSGDFASPKTIPAGGKRYTVQPNDNFWSISRKRYGAGRYYMALALHNKTTVPDPKMMKPGIIIETPDAAVLERLYAESIPKAGPIEPANFVTNAQSRRSVETGPTGYFVSENGDPMYRVGPDDTLTGIAKTHLRRSSRWVQILEMNRNVLRDGNELKIGMVLRLPADASQVRVVGTVDQFR